MDTKKIIPPKSPLGQAIQYMLKHWDALTRFLHVGAPLDNSICERAIKLIRYKKASLFFKTQRGAAIGNGLMSVIHTAVRNDVNALQSKI